uniref:Syndecan n=1 Tax=Ficedula albicollis TaxID=59894 RepID=U3JSZ3_FICAL
MEDWWHLGNRSNWCRLHGKMFFLFGRSALFDKFQQPCFWCDSWESMFPNYWYGDLAGASCWYELCLSFRVCDTCWNNAEKSKTDRGSFPPHLFQVKLQLWTSLLSIMLWEYTSQKRADLTSDKDLYLDNSSVEEASGVYPIDDDDYSSGSGSGAEEDEDSAVMTTSRTVPKLPTTSDASRAETTTVKMQTKVPAQTKSPEEIDKEERPEMDAKKKSDEPGDDTDVFTQKHSENLFQRTEVLAAVIAGGVIGFLFAIFLILLLVYRMRKKDEGSYDLGERKPSCAAYQKAPTKEFYA